MVTTFLLIISMGAAVWLFPQLLVFTASKMSGDPVTTAAGLKDSDYPETTTMLDKNGEPFAYLYNQRRESVSGDEISQEMKDAIVAIEDRRFYDHEGIDYRGTIRALFENLTSGRIEQGASTLDQQLIKNYAWLIESDSDEEMEDATEQSYVRKLREMAISQDLNKDLSKDEILTAYLNLVTYGNGSYGVQDAAQTYFGVDASELNAPQSALLAGLVQSPSYLDPYNNPDGAKERRDVVLGSMRDYGVLDPAETTEFQDTDLGILETPNAKQSGCVSARQGFGHYCDYVRTWLDDRGLADLTESGLTISTTVDPTVQNSVNRALSDQAGSAGPEVAEAMSVIEPGKDSRRVLAVGSSVPYGLEEGQTTQGVPYATVGHGAGSVFKTFVAAAALDKGIGLDTELKVPDQVQVSGMGTSGTPGCPETLYCVGNSGNYSSTMSLRESLAQSPNTPFISLAETVGLDTVMDTAVKMGLRSYAEPGSYSEGVSVQDEVKNSRMGSFVLGPTAVNGVELSNVGATISSGGMWCEPSPVESVTDSDGNAVDYEKTSCDQAMDEGVAHALAQGMSQDTDNGTAAGAANQYNWTSPLAAKTGTTESNQSAAFLGFSDGFAGSSYVLNLDSSSPLCTSPLRKCEAGDLFGGGEPARTFFDAMGPVADGIENGRTLTPHDPKYNDGTAMQQLEALAGMDEYAATAKLKEWGYPTPEIDRVSSDRKGKVVGISGDMPIQGAQLTLEVGQ